MMPTGDPTNRVEPPPRANGACFAPGRCDQGGNAKDDPVTLIRELAAELVELSRITGLSFIVAQCDNDDGRDLLKAELCFILDRTPEAEA